MFPNLSLLAGDKECELLIDSLSSLFVQENDPTLKGRVHQSDVHEMQRFYREYYKLLPRDVAQVAVTYIMVCMHTDVLQTSS